MKITKKQLDKLIEQRVDKILLETTIHDLLGKPFKMLSKKNIRGWEELILSIGEKRLTISPYNKGGGNIGLELSVQ